MQLKNESISMRLPAEMKQKVKAVADRYDMSLSNALLFLLDCGLEDEKNFRPVLIVTSKVMKFSERISERIQDMQEVKKDVG